MEITQKIQGIQGPFFTPQDWGRICWQGWTTWWPCCLRRAPPRRCQELNFQYVLQTFSNRAFKCSDFSGVKSDHARLSKYKPDPAMPCNPVFARLGHSFTTVCPPPSCDEMRITDFYVDLDQLLGSQALMWDHFQSIFKWPSKPT